MEKAQLSEKDLSQLLGGIDIEFLPRQIIDLLLDLPRPGGEQISEIGQRPGVHPAAGPFHFRE